MKQFTVAGKALTAIFAVLLMVGCASTDVTETDGATQSDQERRQMEQQEADRRAAMEAAEAKAAAEKALQDAVMSAGNVVYFDFDKSTLTAETRRVLDAHVALLKTNSDKVRLEGHTDERGTREYNMALGERRAKAAAEYMSVNGIASYRIETVSYGEERPADTGTGTAAWAQNRRVVIK